MAVWQKVITSGSSAVLSQLTVGPAGGAIVQTLANTAAGTSLSGSFSGSHKGDGSGLTGVTATAIFPTTERTGVTASDKFFISQSTGQEYITYSNLLVDLAGTNLATESFDSLTLASVITGLTSVASTQFTGSFIGGHTGSFSGSFTGSFLGTASYATTASKTEYTLTLGNGLTGTSFNGSANVTAAVGAGALIAVGTGVVNVNTASLSANQIPKLVGNQLSGSNISDTGTQITIGAGATSGLSVAAGGISVTGNSSFSSNLTVTGDLSVAGTASFTNTDNLTIRDKFILINSGSTTLADSGWITQYNAAGSGSAFYLEAGTAGTYGAYGRFSVAYDVTGNSTAPTPDEFVVTAKLSTNSAPQNNVSSSWGGPNNSSGNMWIKQDTGDIYIWA